MALRILLIIGILALAVETAWSQVPQPGDDAPLVFAVVTKVPKDLGRVAARVFAEGKVEDSVLLVPDHIIGNPIWRTLEICHSLRLGARKTPDGYKLDSVRVIDSSQLPMELQGVAGDCLIRKALEMAPMAD
ncbi:MAG: hypothetical protein A3H49_09665 [Nitrospirae bacterium RIFCSPLOWO2_02_FULL_62_14]|nr:MAG: hypothetical protein A3H49_09665 [Nitrospirae bacterium RIFCSPLOWO2_02_FULL_62_14]